MGFTPALTEVPAKPSWEPLESGERWLTKQSPGREHLRGHGGVGAGDRMQGEGLPADAWVSSSQGQPERRVWLEQWQTGRAAMELHQPGQGRVWVSTTPNRKLENKLEAN